MYWTNLVRPFVLAVLLGGCTGPAGPEGPQGPAGDPGGNGSTSDPSFLMLDPSALAAGESSEVTILGSNTSFDDSTELDLGEGISIDEVVAQGPAWLTAVMTVAADAPQGPRTLTITTGTAEPEIVVGDDVFTVLPAIPAGPEMWLSQDTLAAGQTAVLRILARDPIFTRRSGILLCRTYVDRVCEPFTGFLSAGTELISASILQLIVKIDLYASAQTLSFVVDAGGRNHVLPIEITATPPTEIAFNTPIETSLGELNDFEAHRFTVVERGRYSVEVTPDDPDLLEPRIEIFSPDEAGNPNDGLFGIGETVGNRLSMNLVYPGTFTFVVADDFADGFMGGGEGYGFTLELVFTPFPDITRELESEGEFSIAGRIEDQWELDIYVLRPTESATIDITIDPGEDPETAIPNSLLARFDEDFHLVEFTDANAADGHERRSGLAVTAGQTYYFGVQGFYNMFTGVGNFGDYVFTVTRQ